MKSLTLLTFLLLTSIGITKSQTISNVQSHKEGNNIVIHYALECDKITDISLFLSEDNGENFKGPLVSISGDVGAVYTSGDKTIIWDVLKDCDYLASENIVFKVKGRPKFGTMIDPRDGKEYKTVNIGSQTFMAKNNAYKPVKGKYWAYNNDQRNVANFGYLYAWETAKNVCPTGWHLPSKEEFETLFENIGGNGKNAYNALIPNGSSGFSALFSGYYDGIGNFKDIGKSASFWSITPSDEGHYWYVDIDSNDTDAGLYGSKECGFSIRCVEN